MLKTLLKDAYDFLDHLNRTGYFDKPKLVPVQKSKTAPGLKYKIEKPWYGDKLIPAKKRDAAIRNHRGPDAAPRRKGKKLYQHEVLTIYNNTTLPAVVLADKYNVDPVTIYSIKRGKTWSKLTGHQK